MVVSRYAIDDYLKQPTTSYDWMKALSREVVDEAIAEIKPVPDFGKIGMDLHQKVGFLIGTELSNFYFQYGVGSGKTRLALELVRHHINVGNLDVAMVLAPTDTICYGWTEEIDKWMPKLPYAWLTENSIGKWEQLEALKMGVCICTYQGFLWMLADLKNKTKTGKKKHLQLNPRLLKLMDKAIQCLVLDEAASISTKDSLIFRALRHLAEHVKFRYLFAGRPFGRKATDLWSQYYVVDRGNTLGETQGMFQEAFYTKKKRYFGGPFSFDYTFNPKMEQLLSERLKNRALFYDSKECIDLPPIHFIPKFGVLPVATRKYYDAQVVETRKARKDGHPGNTFLRMRQISSGFIGVKDDETGDVAKVLFPDNPKLDMLLDFMSSIPEGDQCVIIHEFTPSGQMIHDEFVRLRLAHGWVYGQTKDYPALKRAFDSTPGYHLIINWKKGAEGLNLQRAKWLILFETPTNPLKREQAIARIYRKGSIDLHAYVGVIDLIIRGTQDEKILQAIEEGNDFYDRVVRNSKLIG